MSKQDLEFADSPSSHFHCTEHKETMAFIRDLKDMSKVKWTVLAILMGVIGVMFTASVHIALTTKQELAVVMEGNRKEILERLSTVDSSLDGVKRDIWQLQFLINGNGNKRKTEDQVYHEDFSYDYSRT